MFTNNLSCAKRIHEQYQMDIIINLIIYIWLMIFSKEIIDNPNDLN